MYRIELNKNTMEFTIEKTSINLYNDNDMLNVKIKKTRK